MAHFVAATTAVVGALCGHALGQPGCNSGFDGVNARENGALLYYTDNETATNASFTELPSYLTYASVSATSAGECSTCTRVSFFISSLIQSLVSPLVFCVALMISWSQINL